VDRARDLRRVGGVLASELRERVEVGDVPRLRHVVNGGELVRLLREHI
jgi:hypothetical protein